MCTMACERHTDAALNSKDLSIYIHWPFCVSKCPYCDFNSHVRERIDQQVWQEAYIQDLQTQAQRVSNHTVTSIFFGGGTPSLMDPKLVEHLLKTIHQLWPVSENVEITLEANPNSMERSKFKAFKNAGINRLSLGIQSLTPETLTFLGRAHSEADARKAIETAQSTFENFSLDFMYAHPKHTPEQWHQELQEILTFQAPHLSLYQLTIEPQTPFESHQRQGRFKMPSPLASEHFYDQTHQLLSKQGYQRYEISNFAQDSRACQHNLAYWRYQEYLGIGPGAHGRLIENTLKYATRAHRSPEIWLQKIHETNSALTHNIPLSPQECLEECLIMGLRLIEGLPLTRLEQHTQGISFWNHIGHTKKEALLKEDLIHPSDDFLKLTPQGHKKLNQILTYLLV